MIFVSACLALILLAIIVADMRLMRIPDILPLSLVVLFAVHVAVVGPGTWVLWQMGAAAVVFALGFIAFGLNLMGGGDTKVLPALVLFVPFPALSAAMLAFAAALILSIGAIVLLRRGFARPDHSWAILRETALPMGVPIGLSGLVLLAAATFG